MKARLIIALIFIWVILWVNFLTRDLYRRGHLKDYIVLASSDAVEKHAYTYGEDYYKFLNFAKTTIPEGAFYDFVGIHNSSLNARRGMYYLYPCLKSKTPEYILVYKPVKLYVKRGFRLHALLDKERFILKRK